MKTELIEGKLVLTIELNQNPPLSASGKSRILYSSQGFVKPTGVVVNGKQVSIGINVIAALK